MTPERWEEIEAVFQAALTRDAIERSSFVVSECAGDDELRTEVTALLSAEEESRDFLTGSALEITAGQLAQQRAQSVAGRIVGHYRLDRALGAGGMGEVYLAIDERTDRKVALKLLPDYFNNDPQRVHRFQQEARAVLTLNHPNIVTTYEVGEVDGVSFIASEFIEGETLRQVLELRQPSTREALDLVTQIANALAAAHDAGVIHRDIKPENIMLRPDGYVKVLDFGVAKLNGPVLFLPANPNATSPGMLIGTARYMSPEQARGIDVDGRSDLWSLGVVFYEMLAGRLPFEGATPSDCIAAILEREPPPVQSYRPDVPAELSWSVRKLLRKDRDERYHTAKELLGDLREFQQQFDIQAPFDHTLTRGGARNDLRRSEPAATSIGVSRYFDRYKWAGAGVLAIAILMAIVAVKYLPVKNQSIDSLAVLPFVNAGEDPNSEYLADGVTESLINSLSQVPNLKVIARNSVFRYKVSGPKGAVPDPQKVAQELDVKAVLIGRVLQRGDNLWVSAELVNASDSSHIWGTQYNRKVTDVFAVQAQIAQDISAELGAKLAGESQPQPRNRDTGNLKAFEYYMRGRSYVHRRTREDLLLAGSYYQKAIEEDQNYALAYSGLAEVYGNLGVRGYISPVEGRHKLEEAARKAVALDENLAEAHVMMAYYYMGFAPYDFANGDRELKRALQLSPSLAIAHLYVALSLLRRGRLDEGLNEMLKARELDPFSTIIARQVALYYLLKRDYSRALIMLRQSNESGPPLTTTTEIGIYVQNKLYDEALAALDKESRERKDDPVLILNRGMVYAAQDRRGEALKMVKELEQLNGNDLSQAQWIAKIYAALHDKERALMWLERGETTGAIGSFYRDEPVWDSIRDDPRFSVLVQRVGVPGF
ncbi:MAG: eukaryotic-like serine/threonine-protein kinase [Blastocatellia bacterium]|nr:eukaryotic-like serine/threonine-protein kinase [Blastocatellia bacterium]